MATKEDGLFLNQQYASVIDFSDKSNKFSNLNLNQSHKCSSAKELVHSFSKLNNDKNFATFAIPGYTVIDDYHEKRKTWNKSTKELCLKTFKNLKLSNESEAKSQKRWKHDKTDNKNSSTLSLHIAAYENSFEVTYSTEDFPKKSNAFKIVNSLPKLQMPQDAFEFPRSSGINQQTTPEIQKFTTSQILFSPDQSASSPSLASELPTPQQFLQIDLPTMDNLSDINVAFYACFPLAFILTILIYIFIGFCFGDLPFLPFKGRESREKKHIRKINSDIASLDISGWDRDFFDDDGGDGFN